MRERLVIIAESPHREKENVGGFGHPISLTFARSTSQQAGQREMRSAPSGME
jgi:hypothetical protein